MKFEYTGRHIEVTPALKSHVEQQFNRIDHLFDGRPSKAHVIIEVERGRHRSEIILTWRKDVLNATTTNSDMYKSLSETIAKLEKQALKIKSKITDKNHKKDKSAITIPRPDEAPPRRGRIINARKYAVKPMSDEEAVMMLDDGGDSFLVFRNATNQRVSVIYKRKDGNYGLIQP
ncbi:MAG: ribosome-associated translation inhibitor RaiA [bacterium]|nr:ribosome-associated translation inhibitor RaiA [bacterium]